MDVDYSGLDDDFNSNLNNDLFLPGQNCWENDHDLPFDELLNEIINANSSEPITVKNECLDEFGINGDEINQFESGFNSDNADLQLSPNFDTQTTGVSSPDTLDAVSDVSSTSDLGSMASVSSPCRSQQDTSLVLDFPPNEVISKGDEGTNEKLIFIPASNDNVMSGQQKMKVELSQNNSNVRSISLKSFPHKDPIVVSPPASFIGGQTNGLFNGQTIVVTQAPKGSANLLRKNNTYLKTVSNGKSVYVPLNVKEFNQVRSFKVINGSSSPQVKNGVRIISPAHTVTSQNKTISPKTVDGRPILKVGPTSITTSRYSSSVSVKDEDDTPQNGQELILSDEERRLLKKEQIVLPTHYPLSKQEDRDLKRIRRKIRNKISAQDSRKRKKEYVDSLEERIRIADEEKANLKKKVRTLENQNEYLHSQLNRFKNLLGNGVASRQSAQSTALMMLILSAALIVIPSLRPQDAREGDLSVNTAPPSGQTRTLLEAGVPLVLGSPEAEEEISIDEQEFNTALSDHDYSPLAKRPKLESPIYPEFEMLEKKARSEGEPPDGMASFFAAFFNRLSKNWTDPNQIVAKEPNKIPVGFNTFANHINKEAQSVVVNLNGKGKLLEELELE